MKRIIGFIVGFLAFISNAQVNAGVKFESGLTWAQAFEKARNEKKYVFVDCYTTWCKPCKEMDSTVYSDPSVGRQMGEKFIALKFQMDSTRFDKEQIRKDYSTVNMIFKSYGINAFPTFLFFTPDGEIVHKGIGFKNVVDFSGLLNQVGDREKEYYTSLKAFNSDRLSPSGMKYLSLQAQKLGEKDLAMRVAEEYIDTKEDSIFNNDDDIAFVKRFKEAKNLQKVFHKYLVSLPTDKLFQSKNLVLIRELTTSSKEFGFGLFYNNVEKIEKIMNFPSFAKALVWQIIAKEEVDAKLWGKNGGKEVVPNWNKIKQTITKKYNSYHANIVVLDGQIRWSKFKKDWLAYAKYNIEQIERDGLDTAGLAPYMTNNLFYEIFLHVNEKDVLKKSIKYMEIVMKKTNSAPEIDTYANLLYKTGQIQEAIHWMQYAVEMENKEATEQNRKPKTEFALTLQKMNRGEPTWPTNDNDLELCLFAAN